MLPPRNDRRLRWKVGALALVPIVVMSAFSVWYVYGRPWSISDTLSAQSLPVGQTWDLAGTIHEISEWNSSDGTLVLVDLDEATPCDGFEVRAPNTGVRRADHLDLPIRWESYSFNGHPAVWSPVLPCPFPIVFASVGVVMNAVSLAMGFSLEFVETDAVGWTTYEILTPNGDRFSPRVLPVALRRLGPMVPDPENSPIPSAAAWMVMAAAEYVRLSGFGATAIAADAMDRIDGTSTNGTLRFDDADGDGNVSDGDRFSVRVVPTGGVNDWETFVLAAGEPVSHSYAGGVKYILTNGRGPFEFFPGPETPWVQLLHRAENSGPAPASVLAIGRTRGVVPIADYRVFLMVDGDIPLEGSLATLPLQLPGGIAINVRDANGLLDAGDEIVLTGLVNQTGYSIRMQAQGTLSALIGWYAGYGHVAGRLPPFAFDPVGGTPYVLVADVDYWHPELGFGKTVNVSLWENGVPVISVAPLVAGTLGTFPGGNLSFVDANGDRTLTAGDEFQLSGSTGATYRLRIDLLFGDFSSEIEVTL